MSQILTLLSKVPFLKTIIEQFTGKARLLIEYFMIGVIVTLCGSVFTLWLQKKALDTKLDNVNFRVQALDMQNQIQDGTINHLRELREKDSVAMTNLLTDLKTISNSDLKTRKRISELEASNAQTKAYLDTLVPPELGCLLDDTCKN